MREPRNGHTLRIARPAVVVALLAALLATPALAQQVQIQVARGPHYVGEPIDVHVVAEGFEEEPAPEVSPPTLLQGDATLQYIGVKPSVSSQITIINGQMKSSREVTFAYRYRVLARTPGRVRVGAFEVEQAGVARATAPVELDVRAVPTSNVIDVRLEVPSGPLFVGQKVPVAIEFWIDREVQPDLVSYALAVPLLDRPDLRFVDVPPANPDTELHVQVDSGTLLLPASSSERIRNSRRFLVVRAERVMIPLSAGPIEVPGASVVIDQGTRFRRDLFRQRQATAVRKLMAKSDDVAIEVGEVPRDDRPPSFAGAIGRGFTLEVSADRSVVQLGEPIALTFTLRGDGDLTSAGLPPLDAEGLFDAAKFRLPEDPPAGLVGEDDGGPNKRFDVMVRVLDDSVREIPELAYSWFDADSRSFETTTSRPIALSVRAAQIIGAGEVTRRAGGAGEDALTSATGPGASPAGDAPATTGPARAGSFALTGANLAVERDAQLLLRDERAGGSHALLSAACHVLGIAAVAIAIVDRRRRDVDPEVAAKRRALAKARRELDAALGKPAREAAEEASRSLRQMLALAPGSDRSQLDALLGELDARSYAPPTTDTAPLPDALCETARTLASELVAEAASEGRGTGA